MSLIDRTAPFLQAKFNISGYGGEQKKVPIDFVSLFHPSMQEAQYSNYGIINWGSLYGILRSKDIDKVMSSESIPLYIIVCYNDGIEEYYLMDMDEWYKMGDFITPIEEELLVDWSREGF